MLWGGIEMWFVLILTSVPPLWPLFKPAVQSVLSKTTSNASHPLGKYAKDGERLALSGGRGHAVYSEQLDGGGESRERMRPGPEDDEIGMRRDVSVRLDARTTPDLPREEKREEQSWLELDRA